MGTREKETGEVATSVEFPIGVLSPVKISKVIL
ncbi:hypothetical protein IEU_05615 [Bacillus mycoides]|nr:hypothetical protein IEU_05615 [Bacillus mycoides]